MQSYQERKHCFVHSKFPNSKNLKCHQQMIHFYESLEILHKEFLCGFELSSPLLNFIALEFPLCQLSNFGIFNWTYAILMTTFKLVFIGLMHVKRIVVLVARTLFYGPPLRFLQCGNRFQKGSCKNPDLKFALP